MTSRETAGFDLSVAPSDEERAKLRDGLSRSLPRVKKELAEFKIEHDHELLCMYTYLTHETGRISLSQESHLRRMMFVDLELVASKEERHPHGLRVSIRDELRS